MSIRDQTKDSFIELNARERANALLDEGSCKEMEDPFERMESPHLTVQGIVPQSDDGVVVIRGDINGESAVVISVDGAFMGGGIGEAGGAKIAGALELALRDCKTGRIVRPVLILNTGGVRLQEGNYGLLAIAEVCAAIVELRQYVPVIGVIPGRIGCFGGMSICAGLCSFLVMTRQGRLGLNGPEVIQQEAGVVELDASDRPLIWRMVGGEQRHAVGFADILVEDSTRMIRDAVNSCLFGSMDENYRNSETTKYLSRISAIDPAERIEGADLRTLWGRESSVASARSFPQVGEHVNECVKLAESRGRTWFERLSGQEAADCYPLGSPSVLCADGQVDGQSARFIAVTPNSCNRFARTRNGEVGVVEGWTLARCIQDAIQEDAGENVEKRAIVAIVDVPGQAYGYMEELLGIHQACAAAANAYASARLAGHPVIALLVGKAISGAFLAHGLQANRIIALDDPEIRIQVMSRTSAARITRRTAAELEETAIRLPATASDIQSFAALGALDDLVGGINADNPQQEDLERIRNRLASAIADIRIQGIDLRRRLQSKEAAQWRAASIRVRERLASLWS